MSDKSNKTVFVVGAGASHEFGLPIGTKLQEQISHQTRLRNELGRILPFSHNRRFLKLLPAAAGLQTYTSNDQTQLALNAIRISAGVNSSASIDNYLHANRFDEELVAIGKLAIATCILEAENASSLAYSPNGVGFKGPQSRDVAISPHNSWIGILVKTLSAGRDFKKFCEALDTVTFVCFNYDRCIERYISEAASLIYPKSEFDFVALERSLRIIHPYGSLGDLRSELGPNGTFGKGNSEEFLLTAAKNIRTFTEGIDSDVRLRIGDAFAEASSAIFFGYGFITVNDRFIFGKSPFEIGSVLGTTFGISDERRAAINTKLQRACLMRKTPHDGWQHFGQKAELRSEGCANLLQRFSHKLEEIGQIA